MLTKNESPERIKNQNLTYEWSKINEIIETKIEN